MEPTAAMRAKADAAARVPWWDKATFTAFVACLVWAPLPLGSNRPWALGLLATVLWGLVLVYLLGAVAGRHSRWRRRLGRAAGPLALLACFSALVAPQLLPAAAAWGLQTQDAFQTRVYLLASLAYLGGFALTVLTVSSASRASWLLGGVVAAGVLQALIAVVLASTGASYQYLFADFHQGGRATGTFPNPDHLAGYMELCLAAGLGLLLAQFSGQAQPARGWRQKTIDALAFLMSPKMLLRMMLVVMVVALVMTRSRMGNGAFFLALLLVGSVVAVASRALRRPALWLVASMAVIDIFIIGQWVGLDRVVERMRGSAQATAVQAAPVVLEGFVLPPHREDSLQERLQVPMLSWPLVERRPWFGHGGGTYVLAFPGIKPAGFPHHWDHAHNDFVEIAVDTGLVGLGLLLALALATAWRAGRVLHDAQPRLKRGVGVAALMALFSIGLHSTVDFNLQIPANALTLVVLLALVWAMPHGTAAPAPSPGAG